MNTGLETIARVRFTVLQKLVFCDEKLLIVAESLVRVESHIEGGHCQGVPADQEVVVVVDEDGVLQGLVEEQVDLVVVRT